MMQEEQGDLCLPSPSSYKRHGCRYNLPATEVILVKDWPKKSGVTKEKTIAGEDSEYKPFVAFQGQVNSLVRYSLVQ